MWNVPLMENDSIIERPADQYTITKRYTEKAVAFIEQHAPSPFFLYLPHSMVHTPLFASAEFQGVNPRGTFGDVMAEVDWSVGQILQTLEDLQLTENTLVVFTSDNGPWLSMQQDGGSAGLLRDGKGTTWEGGMRVPGPISGMGSTLDLLPTIAALTGAVVPTDRILDGYDLTPVLRERSASPRDHFFFYRQRELYAARQGPYKAHYRTETCYVPETNRREHTPPLLYQLEQDPSEKYDRSAEQPEVLAAIQALVTAHAATVRERPAEMEKY
jgi:uncharacterized sulfatase